jgi:hypothetical protein
MAIVHLKRHRDKKVMELLSMFKVTQHESKPNPALTALTGASSAAVVRDPKLKAVNELLRLTRRMNEMVVQ